MSECPIHRVPLVENGLGWTHKISLCPVCTAPNRASVIEEWAQDMARMCDVPDAGWSIYADWLRAFLSAMSRADRFPLPSHSDGPP